MLAGAPKPPPPPPVAVDAVDVPGGATPVAAGAVAGEAAPKLKPPLVAVVAMVGFAPSPLSVEPVIVAVAAGAARPLAAGAAGSGCVCCCGRGGMSK